MGNIGFKGRFGFCGFLGFLGLLGKVVFNVIGFDGLDIGFFIGFVSGIILL